MHVRRSADLVSLTLSFCIGKAIGSYYAVASAYFTPAGTSDAHRD